MVLKKCLISIHIKLYQIIYHTLQCFATSLKEYNWLFSGLMYALEQTSVFSQYKIFVSSWKHKSLTSSVNRIKVFRTLQAFASYYSQHPTSKIRNFCCFVLYPGEKQEHRKAEVFTKAFVCISPNTKDSGQQVLKLCDYIVFEVNTGKHYI